MTACITRATIEHMYRQPTLFAIDDVAIDESFSALERRWLDDACFVDFQPDWLRGADVVFDQLLAGIEWRSRTVPMYERMVEEPRLHGWWAAGGAAPEPLPVLGHARIVLSDRYAVVFDSIGFNQYRDRHDSVAWHRDRHRRTVHDPIVAIVSVGQRRPFRLRPYGGGASVAFELGDGDLFVMGGACQDRWEHTVPKLTAGVGPRISITYRHGAS